MVSKKSFFNDVYAQKIDSKFSLKITKYSFGLISPNMKGMLSETELRYRAEILFSRYPRIKKGYQSSRRLNRIYQHTKEKGFVFTKLAQWSNEVDQANIKSFNSIRRSIEHHY